MNARRRRRQAAALATAAFFTLATTTGALADGKRVRLAVVDVDGNSSNDSVDIHYFVEKGVRQSGKLVQLTPLDDVLNAGAQATDIQNIVFGHESLVGGMKSFNGGNCEEAIDQLGEAVTYFEQSFAFLDTPEEYIKALVHQAVCLVRVGSQKAATQVLEKAFTVNPKLEFAAFEKERQAFEAAKTAVKEKPLTSIAVTTTPEGSRVFVDGRFRGVSPAYRPGLRQGVHFVRVERQGYARVGMKASTAAKGKKDLKIDVKQDAARNKAVLDGLLPGLRAEMGLPEAGKSTTRLQSLLLVDYVVLYRASGPSPTKKVELALYNLGARALLKKVEATVNWEERDKAAKNAVLGLVNDLLSVELQTMVKVDTPGNDGKPGGTGGTTSSGGVHTKWWFWTIIGAAVLGTTVGLAIGLQPEEEKKGLDEDGNGSLILRF